MKKMLSLLLLAAMLLLCLSGCATPPDHGGETETETDSVGNTQPQETEPQETEPIDEKSEYALALEELLAKLRADAEHTDKLQVYVEYEDLHRELKASGEYDGESWTECGLEITVNCDYSLAADEPWYPTDAAEDLNALNQAFFDLYADELTEGHFSCWGIVPALYFSYAHTEDAFSDALEDFYADYEMLPTLLELGWVTGIHVGYRYSMPRDYFLESENQELPE